MTHETRLNLGELVSGIVTLALAVHAMVWAAIHCHKMYQDLYTEERGSVKHSRKPPQITKIYKQISWTTTISICAYAGAITSTAAISNVSIENVTCKILTLCPPLFWQIAKCFMFLTYILLLRKCYALSVVSYSDKKLLAMAAFIITLSILTLWAIIAGVGIGQMEHGDADGQYPFQCTYKVHETYSPVLAFGFIIFNVIFTMIAIVAFMVPITRLFKVMKASEPGPDGSKKINDKRHKKMLHAGYKYKICVICASVTSFIWIMTSFSNQVPWVTQMLAGVDWTINIFCLMFITPYYPDSKYYLRLCKLCIFCCDREKQSHHAQSNEVFEHNLSEDQRSKCLEPSSTTKQTSTTTKTVSSADQNP